MDSSTKYKICHVSVNTPLDVALWENHLVMEQHENLKLSTRFLGLSRFHFGVRIFFLELMHVKYDWLHVPGHEIFETVKLKVTATGLEPTTT